jgi:cytochrome P450
MISFESVAALPPSARIKELFDYFATRRATEAAGPSEQDNVWEVFRYDEAMAVLADYQTFTSDKSALIPADQRQLAGVARGNFIGTDPPQHTRLRNVVSKAFTPRVVAELEPRVRELATSQLDQALAESAEGGAAGSFDLSQDFASRLSAAVIAQLFGIPAPDHKRFWTWSDGLLGARSHGSLGRMDEAAMRRLGELLQDAGEYVTAHIKACRENPGTDLTSQLVHTEIDGEPLAEDEIFGILAMFVIAGHMSTAVLIGNTVMCLDEHPDTLAEVRADPALLEPTIEEVLRYRPALMRDQRMATRDTEIAGVPVPRGGNVCVWLASANRDERYFADAATFDIHRSANPHRAFGRGIHYCLGSALARLETRIAVEELLRRLPDLHVATDGEIVFHPSIGMMGPVNLPVVASVGAG